MPIADEVEIYHLGIEPYAPILEKMQSFTDTRTDLVCDEIWLLQHEPVFTQGQAGKSEHILDVGDIPIFQADRGGQVTYHGPGQLVVYLLINLRRKKIGVRDLVDIMESSLIDLLSEYGIEAHAKPDAPGVYVDGEKIASLGLRVRHGCSFHGLALNLDMNLEPFLRINPCGYSGLSMTQLADLVDMPAIENVMQGLIQLLIYKIGYTKVSHHHAVE